MAKLPNEDNGTSWGLYDTDVLLELLLQAKSHAEYNGIADRMAVRLGRVGADPAKPGDPVTRYAWGMAIGSQPYKGPGPNKRKVRTGPASWVEEYLMATSWTATGKEVEKARAAGFVPTPEYFAKLFNCSIKRATVLWAQFGPAKNRVPFFPDPKP